MNLLIGNREAWYPLNAQTQHDLDELPRQIFIRPAVRHYDMSGPFDAWRVAIDTWFATRVECVKQYLAGRLSASRAILDYRAARAAYRAARAISRDARRCAWEIFFGDDRDLDWVLGAVACAAFVLVLIAIYRAW